MWFGLENFDPEPKEPFSRNTQQKRFAQQTAIALMPAVEIAEFGNKNGRIVRRAQIVNGIEIFLEKPGRHGANDGRKAARVPE
jgi:hypothetical protein